MFQRYIVLWTKPRGAVKLRGWFNLRPHNKLSTTEFDVLKACSKCNFEFNPLANWEQVQIN